MLQVERVKKMITAYHGTCYNIKNFSNFFKKRGQANILDSSLLNHIINN